MKQFDAFTHTTARTRIHCRGATLSLLTEAATTEKNNYVIFRHVNMSVSLITKPSMIKKIV